MSNRTPIRWQAILYATLFVLCTFTIIPSCDPATWIMEVIPVYAGMITLLILSAKGVELSKLLNIVIPIHIAIMTIGGIFTYANVPFFNPTDWLGETLGWERNNYDKLGHFMQGFTPYLATQELLAKKNILKKGFLLFFLCISVSLAISALYELIEFGTSVSLGSAADDFIGSQGDSWDTQKDMLWAFVGGLTAALFFKNHYNKPN